MVNSMTPLRLLQRWMLGLWLAILAALALAAGVSITGEQPGSLVAFLFSRPVTQVRLEPAPPQSMPAPEQAAAPEAPAAVPPSPQPEWQPLARGNRRGAGSMSHPVLTGMDDGRVMVTFDYDGTLGDLATYVPDNVDALSADMQGAWKTDVSINQRLAKGLVCSRLQIFRHEAFLRISCVRSGTVRGKLSVEAAARGTQWRVIFAEDRP